jgi:hypothetical protein
VLTAGRCRRGFGSRRWPTVARRPRCCRGSLGVTGRGSQKTDDRHGCKGKFSHHDVSIVDVIDLPRIAATWKPLRHQKRVDWGTIDRYVEAPQWTAEMKLEMSIKFRIVISV